jgi:hypothetical protein
MEQRAKQLACWAEPFVHLRMPRIFNLEPFERQTAIDASSCGSTATAH